MDGFKIKTETFEGPLDLLLSFIEKRKLLINEISLAKITDDYLGHIQSISDHSIGDRAEFIVTASTLLLIKSRSLLPNLSLSDEEEQNISDLEDRLKLYQKIKDNKKAAFLTGTAGHGVQMFDGKFDNQLIKWINKH